MKEDNIGRGAIPHSRGVQGSAHGSKEPPATQSGGKRDHPEVTTTTGAKKDGHRVKVRGAKKA